MFHRPEKVVREFCSEGKDAEGKMVVWAYDYGEFAFCQFHQILC